MINGKEMKHEYFPLYILIREMTGSNTQHITRVVNQMKQQYLLLNTEYQKEGSIDTSNTGSIFA